MFQIRIITLFKTILVVLTADVVIKIRKTFLLYLEAKGDTRHAVFGPTRASYLAALSITDGSLAVSTRFSHHFQF